MLTLSRNEGESLIISFGEKELYLTITRIRGARCRVVMDGPREIKVWRAEVTAAKKAEYIAARAADDQWMLESTHHRSR